MRVLAIALLTAAAAQASLVDRKRAGRGLEDEIAEDSFKPETFTFKKSKQEVEECGVLFSPPCKDEGCFPGLILDTVKWTYLLQSELACGWFNLCGGARRMSEAEPERKLGGGFISPEDAPTCVPCGELLQLPCPCEDECAPKCSEGLIATNLIGYDNVGSPDRRLGDDGPSPELLAFVTSINLCLPCGGQDQPPCESTGCLPGLVAAQDSSSNVPTTVCTPCGGDAEPCCCDSSEVDVRFRETLTLANNKNWDEAILGDLLVSILQSPNTDPTKCLAGCDSGSRCGKDNVCTPNP